MKTSKKILIFSLILVLFMSISAISAADAGETIATDMNQNDGSLNTIDDSIIAANENEEFLSDDNTVGTLSFSELNSQIKSNSEITLDSDVEYKSGDTADGITIGKNMAINGNGHTIDAKSKTRIFKVASGCTLTLSNVNIVNGYMSSQSGGAILSSGTLKLTNCNFTNCNVGGSNTGGAISGSGAGSIVKCNFDKCSAGSRGGAASSNKLKFNYCNFTSCTAGFGGAISGTAYLYNSIFKNCKSTSSNNYDGGGAGSGEFPRVEGCKFINCKANGYGGALRGTTNSYNCEFEGCVAKQGGAIRGKGITSGCTFKNCVATKDMGGAIFTEKATITKCNFIECSSTKSNAGAVFIGNNVKINNCKFTKCSAPKGSGGAVYGNGVITKCTFEKNRAKLGGAVSSYSITVKSSTFIGNKAGRGGAAYNIKKLASCKFNNNTATYGGAVYNAQTVTSSKFMDNFAKYGAVSYNKVNTLFKKASIKNTLKLGQGLFYNDKHKLTLTASKIINTGKFGKYLNYNTGTFIYTKNSIKSSPKVKKIASPRNVQKK